MAVLLKSSPSISAPIVHSQNDKKRICFSPQNKPVDFVFSPISNLSIGIPKKGSKKIVKPFSSPPSSLLSLKSNFLNLKVTFGIGQSVESFRQSSKIVEKKINEKKIPKKNFRWDAVWLDNKAQTEVPVSLEASWKLWEDRESIPRWMPWIASVKVQKDKPDLSRWTLQWDAFGQNFEFSWLAKTLQPIQNQKIHWKSVDGLPNRGAVRFYPRGPDSCTVELTISYEVPQVLQPFAAGLAPVVESIIQADLNRFSEYAKKQSLQSKV